MYEHSPVQIPEIENSRKFHFNDSVNELVINEFCSGFDRLPAREVHPSTDQRVQLYCFQLL